MKKYIAIFSISFVLMFCIGLGSGRSSIKEPGFLKNYAFSHVKVSLKDKKFILTFGSKDKILYWYDIDENVLHEEDRSFQNPFINDTSLEADLSDLILEPGPIHAISLLVAQEILSKLKTETLSPKKTLIVSALGIISGYSLGYWIAKRTFLPSLDTDEIISIVDNEDTWSDWEKYVLRNIYFKIRDMINNIEDVKEKNTYNKTLDFVVRPMKNEKHDFRSSDLNALLRFYSMMKYNQEESFF